MTTPAKLMRRNNRDILWLNFGLCCHERDIEDPFRAARAIRDFLGIRTLPVDERDIPVGRMLLRRVLTRTQAKEEKGTRPRCFTIRECVDAIDRYAASLSVDRASFAPPETNREK